MSRTKVSSLLSFLFSYGTHSKNVFLTLLHIPPWQWGFVCHQPLQDLANVTTQLPKHQRSRWCPAKGSDVIVYYISTFQALSEDHFCLSHPFAEKGVSWLPATPPACYIHSPLPHKREPDDTIKRLDYFCTFLFLYFRYSKNIFLVVCHTILQQWWFFAHQLLSQDLWPLIPRWQHNKEEVGVKIWKKWDLFISLCPALPNVF